MGVSREQQNLEAIRERFEAGVSIINVIADGYFKNTFQHPSLLERKTIVKKCEHCGQSYVEVENKEKVKELKQMYWEEQKRLQLLFKQALMDFHRLNIHDLKVIRAYDLAWERGHSGGLSEVANEFHDLIPLIK